VGGFDLAVLSRVCGIPPEKITFANRDKYRIGYSQAELAALYSAADVLLAASYGEGFGVPQIEAQACGTRVIASNWAASPDLIAEDGWLVDGQPFFDAPQAAFFQVPLLGSVVSALEQAYEAERGFSAVSRKFALDFDEEKVWQDYWMPFLKDYFGGTS
jgi:glycosyltransferase involved in cell wall biosynthesis